MSNLNVAFRGDTSHLNKSIKGVSAGIKGLGAAMKTAFLPLAAVGAAIGGIGAAFKGVGLAADLETVHTKFETILKDTKQATQLIEDLRETAKTTPYTFEEITGAADQLVARLGSGDAMFEKLRQLGDVASGSGASLKELTETYTKIASKGKLDTEGLEMFTTRVSVFGPELAKALGMSEKEMRKFITTGKIGIEEVDQVFKNLTKEGGTFFQSMQKQSLTWNGLVSTLKSNIDDMLASFAAPILGALKPFLQDSISFAENLTEVAEKAGKMVAKVITGFRVLFKDGKIGDFLSTALSIAGKSFINIVWKGFIALGPIMQGVGNIIVAVVKDLGTLIKNAFTDAMAAMEIGTLKMASIITAAFAKILPEGELRDTVNNMSGIYDSDSKTRAFFLAKEQAGREKSDMGQVAAEAFKGIGPKALDTFKNTSGLFNTQGELNELKGFFSSLTTEIEKNTQAISTDKEKSKTVEEKPKWGFEGQNLTNVLPELARIGGARGISGRFQNNIRAKMLEETKKQTKVNEETRDAVRDLKTINMGGAVLG